MDPFAQLVVATAAFLLTHFASSTPLRPALIGALGEKGYRALYTIAALATPQRSEVRSSASSSWESPCSSACVLGL